MGRCVIKSLFVGISLACCVLADPVQTFNSALSGLINHDMGKVDKVFARMASKNGSNRLLALYELGNLYHLNGDFKKSIQVFNTADAVIRNYENQALVSVSNIARNGISLIGSDAVLCYKGLAYEKILLHTINAINYLFIDDLEGACVELRKIDEYQRQYYEKKDSKNGTVRETLKRDIGNLGTEQYDNGYGTENTNLNASCLVEKYDDMFNYVSGVNNSAENVLSYYLASQIYFLSGKNSLDDALIAIRRAYELMPNHPAIKSAYLELTSDTYHTKNVKPQVKANPNDSLPLNNNAGSVTVLFESGLVPHLKSIEIPFLIKGHINAITFPIYSDFDAAKTSLTIDDSVTITMINIRKMAIKALQERIPEIAVRSLSSALIKSEIWSALNFLTSADCRSWLSLPAEVQVAQFSLSAGRKSLIILGDNWKEVLTLDITSGSRNFVLVRSLPGFRKIDVKTFNAK